MFGKFEDQRSLKKHPFVTLGMCHNCNENLYNTIYEGKNIRCTTSALNSVRVKPPKRNTEKRIDQAPALPNCGKSKVSATGASTVFDRAPRSFENIRPNLLCPVAFSYFPSHLLAQQAKLSQKPEGLALPRETTPA